MRLTARSASPFPPRASSASTLTESITIVTGRGAPPSVPALASRPTAFATASLRCRVPFEPERSTCCVRTREWEVARGACPGGARYGPASEASTTSTRFGSNVPSGGRRRSGACSKQTSSTFCSDPWGALEALGRAVAVAAGVAAGKSAEWTNCRRTSSAGSSCESLTTTSAAWSAWLGTASRFAHAAESMARAAGEAEEAVLPIPTDLLERRESEA